MAGTIDEERLQDNFGSMKHSVHVQAQINAQLRLTWLIMSFCCNSIFYSFSSFSRCHMSKLFLSVFPFIAEPF